MAYSTKQSAQTTANRVAARLKKELGGNWKTRVWSNMGWHANAYLSAINVSIYNNHHTNKNTYMVLISDTPKHPSAGACHWSTDHNNYSTPEAAVLAGIEKVKEYLNTVNEHTVKNSINQLNIKKVKITF